MNRPHPFKRFIPILSAALLALSLTGCQKDIVHQRSMAELTQKAQSMMQAGDYAGAVARLESAHDLQPEDVRTTFNLAVAYQMQGNNDKAIEFFNQLLQKPGIEQGGINPAELHKNLGVCYEAKADQLGAKTGENNEDGAKETVPDKAKMAENQQAATENYKLALDHYQQAISGKVQNAEQVQQQIQALESKLNNPASALHP